MTPIRIGIADKRNELCTLDHPDYAEFFHSFQRMPVELQSVDYTEQALANCDALLIGAPREPLSATEVQTIRQWVQSGGRLLLLSTMGGDSAVDCSSYHQTNLHEISFGVQFTDTGTGREIYTRQMGYGNQLAFHSHCLVDVSHWTPHQPRMTYVDGCALRLDEDAEYAQSVTTKLSLPIATKSINYFRVDRSHHGTRPYTCRGEALIQLKVGKGSVTSFGAVKTLNKKGLSQSGNPAFVFALVSIWLDNLVGFELARRMEEPQRHRLLQAYPMAPLMYPSENNPLEIDVEQAFARRSVDKRLLIGVLPHPYCNPMVKGCGFCTFPHEQYTRNSAQSVAKTVLREIEQRIEHFPHLTQSPVDAIYFGGATANLTPLDDFANILQTLYTHLQCENAEVTLEGAPIYFLRGKGPDLLRLLSNTTNRGRISMGIQTFDPQRLKSMGRQGYGNQEDIAQLVRTAQQQNLTTSCDLLIDLPHQTLPEILEDIQIAMDLGFDQICIYHLVLFEGLGTEWAKDPEKLAGLPSNIEAATRWSVVRQYMHDQGYRQTTITNFEKKSSIEKGRNFLYEAHEMNLVSHDFIGFGPAGINRMSSADTLQGYKLLTPSDSGAYLKAMENCTNGLPAQGLFQYDAHDMQILYLTRHIGRSQIDKELFQQTFGQTIAQSFPLLYPTIEQGDFIEPGGRLTDRGNTFADSVAGLLAWPKIIEREITDRLKSYIPPSEEVYANRARRHHMG